MGSDLEHRQKFAFVFFPIGSEAIPAVGIDVGVAGRGKVNEISAPQGVALVLEPREDLLVADGVPGYDGVGHEVQAQPRDQ